ncbi:MAG: hypothetical protein ACP5C4_04405 [Methanomicrobiales archaeon]
MEENRCPGSGHEFHSILPPVSNHFSRDAADFADRVSRLSDEVWSYIADQILSGGESLGCIPEEDLDVVVAHIAREVSEEAAEKIRLLDSQV